MHPISGPVRTVHYNNVEGKGSYYVIKDRYRQARPYDLALPYFVSQYVTLEMDTSGDSWMTSLANAMTVSADVPAPYFWDQIQPEADASMNAAIEKYRQRMSESSELLVTLAERKQAMEMIINRSSQLLSLARAIWRRDLKGITRLIDNSTRKGNRKIIRRAKGFASAWLEFSFGWVPLVKDIGGAVTLLEAGIPEIPVWGSYGVPFKRGASWGTSVEGWQSSANGRVRCRVGSRLRVDNPNLALANRLGFTNPFTVAWELVPYSFVVDWFIPVQGFLQNFSSSHGISEVGAYNTRHYVGTGTYTAWVKPPYPVRYFRTVRAGFRVQRNTGIPGIVLRPRAPWQLSSWRAANIVSLLVGFLKTKA